MNIRSKVAAALLLGAIGFTASAQDKFAKKYAAVITAEGARKHLSILASDDFEGRETGKPGAEKAAQYIKAEFKRLGLKGPVNGDYFQDLDLKEKVVTERNISVNGKMLEAADFLLSSFSGPKITYSNFVFAGYGIKSPKYDDLTGADIAGKAVIILAGEPMVNGNYVISGTTVPSEYSTGRLPKKVAMLREMKPALIITVTPSAQIAAGSRFLASGRPQLILGQEVTAPTSSIALSPEAADMLMARTGKKMADLQKGMAETGKSAPLSFTSSLAIDVKATYTPVPAKDVLGYMEGSDPKLKKEVLVFSAHYDHIGLTTSGTDKVNNGADDDGSGTTGILEIAAAFSKAKKEKHGPKRSILFLGNVGEEKGLLGSEWYTDHPVFPLESTVADLNIDMIGRVGEEYIGKPDSANYVYVIGSAMLSTTLRKISENANNTYLNMIADYKYDDLNDPNRYYYRSDHYNFAKHGVPIIFYFNGVHADYHRPGDEVSKINFPLLAKRAQLAFYTGWDIANRAERPPVDVKTEGLSAR